MERKPCNRCKMNMTIDKFKKKRDDSYEKTCIECNAKEREYRNKKKCAHGKRKCMCKDCGGSQICIHDRMKSQCKDCGGSQICIHDRRRNACKDCDPSGHLIQLVRSTVYNALQGSKTKHSIEYLGCTIEEFKKHIEDQFEEGMSWENHGEWHIDHRRPCASFNLVNEEEQRMCFHHTNLQPMWAPENISKSDSFDEESFEWEWTGEKWEPIE